MLGRKTTAELVIGASHHHSLLSAMFQAAMSNKIPQGAQSLRQSQLRPALSGDALGLMIFDEDNGTGLDPDLVKGGWRNFERGKVHKKEEREMSQLEKRCLSCLHQGFEQAVDQEDVAAEVD